MGRPISSIGRWMAANVKDQVCSHAKHRLRCISASHGKPRLGPARLLPADGTHRSCTVAPLPSLNCQSSTHCSDPTGSSVRSSDLCTPSPSALAGRPSPVGAFGLTKRILPRIGQPARARTAAAPASELLPFTVGRNGADRDPTTAQVLSGVARHLPRLTRIPWRHDQAQRSDAAANSRAVHAAAPCPRSM